MTTLSSRSESMKAAWKLREDYTGGFLGKKIHNSWRAFRFTKKGKNAGCSQEWLNFKNFYSDMNPSYIEGYVLCRINKHLPFSKENCYWSDKTTQYLGNDRIIHLTYNNETLSLKEWAIKLNNSYNGIRWRYHKNKDYTTHDILYGKTIRKRKLLPENQNIRIRASKLLSTYKLRDKKKGLEFNLTTDWVVSNILQNPCVYCGCTDRLGVDRIDNTIGHICNNVVTACYHCNVTRGDIYSYDEMLILGKTIKKIKENRLCKFQNT